MTQAYPLQWPPMWPRTEPYKRQRAAFLFSQEKAQQQIVAEVRRLGGTNLVISTNIAIRKDGLPYTNQPKLTDPGVAIYFTLKGQARSFACDRWDLVKDNMKAIANTIEALRGIERWGSSKMVDQAFAGFTALPAPESAIARDWPQVLNVMVPTSRQDVDIAYRKLAKQYHPDTPGGSETKMIELNQAYEQAKKVVR